MVPGTDPDIVEALLDAGIATVGDLADAGLQTVEQALDQAIASGRMDQGPTLYGIAEIQRAAARWRSTGFIRARVVDLDDGAPVAGASISIGGRRTETGVDGWFIVTRLPQGVHTLEVQVVTGRPLVFAVQVAPYRAAATTVIRVPLATLQASAPTVASEQDGAVLAFRKGMRLRFIDTELSSLPHGTLLIVRHFYRNGQARLLSLSRSVVGMEMQVSRLRVSATDLPENSEIGDVVESTAAGFVASDQTLRMVAETRISNVLNGRTLTPVSQILS